MSTGTGLTVNADGYLRIKKRGPNRDQMAHRVYVERQIGRKLTPHEEVHHQCRNRACWPPTDFHLILVDSVLGPFMYQEQWLKKKRMKRRVKK
jgi:hypothetical protein